MVSLASQDSALERRFIRLCRGRDESIFADARVLIIDDVEANVILLRRILRTAGVTHVVGLTDPCAAVDRCREFGPDLVLLDLHMPTMDGIELMRRVPTIS